MNLVEGCKRRGESIFVNNGGEGGDGVGVGCVVVIRVCPELIPAF